VHARLKRWFNRSKRGIPEVTDCSVIWRTSARVRHRNDSYNWGPGEATSSLRWPFPLSLALISVTVFVLVFVLF
jgi:hypothetical protein